MIEVGRPVAVGTIIEGCADGASATDAPGGHRLLPAHPKA